MSDGADKRNLARGGRSKQMPKKPKKHVKVAIQFDVGIPEAEEATVILRDDQMVIDMQEPDGVTKYLIVGKPVGYYFQGVNSAGPRMPKVRVVWVKLGKVFVGQWLEDGQEYLFSFELKTR
jgi:hypothetical protein